MKRVEAEDVTILSAELVPGESRRESERATVAELLRSHYGREMTLGHTESGAPLLQDADENISVSHSARRAVVTLSRRPGVGIDTETLRPQLERVKKKYLSAEEQRVYRELHDLLWAWSAKEAVYKAALIPGLPLAEGIRLRGAYADVTGGGLYKLVTIEDLPDEVTVMAVKVDPVGRFAPSPSGRMHLGNIFSAVLSYLSVKSRGGRWILRIEDLDPQRSKAEHSRAIEDDLAWLGLEYDEGGLEGLGPHGPYSQSLRHDIYEEYLNSLVATGYTYPCICTRAEIMATQAPHAGDGRVVYGGRCRPRMLPSAVPPPDRPYSTRLYVPDREITFIDRTYGAQTTNLATDSGDFIVRRADGAWAYQLAVVVDDALMGVTEVVRGSDLLMSSAQQIYMYDLLGFVSPEWAHVPLLTAPDGRRLAKRDKSMAMDELRRRYTPSELLGLVGKLAGLNPSGEPLTLAELTERYRPERLSKAMSIALP